MSRKILITGGSGLIGSHLSKALKEKGYEVVILGRKENLKSEIPIYKWDITSCFIDERAFEGVTDVIHLAGAGIADSSWTNQRKQELIDSRVKSAALLIEFLQKFDVKLHSFTGASAIGYYGAYTTEKVFFETDLPANDFLGKCCKVWEESYQPIIDVGVRT
ncbi:MAG: NAD-dependent epimerase/dehydratase family protein, partial [Bacteroidota bacterium]